MKKRKMIMFISILFMAIGFASVSAVLYLNGQIGIVGNTGDFDVYFSKAIENGVENSSIIKDRNHLEFTTELRVVDEEYVLDYEVTNASKQYDASLLMNCTGGNDFLRVSNEFDIEEILPARTKRAGKLTLKVIKNPLEEMEISIICEIKGNAVEKTEINENDIAGGIEEKDEPMLEAGSDTKTFFGHEFDRSKVEKITFIEDKAVPDNAMEAWDASGSQDGSIMVYTLDENQNDLYELYIGKDKAPFIANPDSSSLFEGFTNLISIVDLEKLDTSQAINMSRMFYNCGKLKEFNLSNFNTENVTDMSSMFDMGGSGSNSSAITSLDLNSFDTSKVTNMNRMFYTCRELKTLNLGHFNTGNVTDMSFMFSRCHSLTSLNISNFDTNNVTDMNNMFSWVESLITLDLNHFNTSNVTDMNSMFRYCVNLKTLKISNFDTSNVTNMSCMFYQSYAVITTINIRGTKCTNWRLMFHVAATSSTAQITVNYTADASSLVDGMIGTKYNGTDSPSKVKKGGIITF